MSARNQRFAGPVFANIESVRVRIIVSPKDEVDGAEVDLLRVGGTYDLPLPLAGLLILEGKAVAEQRQRDRTPAVNLPAHQLIRLKFS